MNIDDVFCTISMFPTVLCNLSVWELLCSNDFWANPNGYGDLWISSPSYAGAPELAGHGMFPKVISANRKLSHLTHPQINLLKILAAHFSDSAETYHGGTLQDGAPQL